MTLKTVTASQGGMWFAAVRPGLWRGKTLIDFGSQEKKLLR